MDHPRVVQHRPEMDETVDEALTRVQPAVEAAEKLRLPGPPEFTVSALRLRIFDPAHWQVLGPLLVSEIERAHAMGRRGLASGIQERELRLDGRIPTPRG